MSQTVAVLFMDAETSRVESDEKSTPLISRESSLCEKACLCVFASHTNNSPKNVPAAIHLLSLDTARHTTAVASILATCVPSSSRHTRTPPSPPLKTYLPFAENVAANTRLPTPISIGGPRCSYRTISFNACPTLSVPTGHGQSGFLRHNITKKW